MHLIALYFLCFAWSIDGFTRQFRSVELVFQKQDSDDFVLSFDAIPTNVPDQVSRICGTVGCTPRDEYTMSKAINDRFKTKLLVELRDSYLSYLNRTSDNDWMQYTDINSQSRYISTRYDVTNINAGRLYHFSPYCNNQRNLNKSQCEYAKNIEPLVNETVSTGVMSVTQLDSLIHMFNAHMYDHCEALCYHYLNKVLKNVYESDLGLNASLPSVPMSVEGYERLVRLSTMLTEINLSQGLLEVASLYSTLTVFCYEMNQNYRPEYEKVSYIARLRAIVTFPSLPRDRESLVLHRREMIEDLQSLIQTIKQDNAVVSLDSLLDVIPSTNFHMAHQGLNDREMQVTLAEAFSTLCPQLQYTSPRLSTSKTINMNDPQLAVTNPDDPTLGSYILKIAFLSSHFFDHSIGRILIDMFLVMKKFQLKLNDRYHSIQVIVYYLDRGTELSHTVYDSVTGEKQFVLAMDKSNDDIIVQNLEKHFGRNFVRLPLDVEVVRAVLEKEKLDFLFYADVGMEFVSYLLSFSRLAVYQAAWWGHPITTGMNSIDYFISIDEEVLTADEHYSEQLVRLNGINTVPLQQFNRAELQQKYLEIQLPAGLTADSKISLVIGRLFKIHPDFIAILVDLMLSTLDDKKVKLVFIAEKIHHYQAHIHSLIKNRLSALNISAYDSFRCIEKVNYVHYNYYFELISMARVVLDTWPYGGCLTAHDALAYQAPLVTLPSEFIRGRFTLALYNQMEHTDLIADNATHYIQLAEKLLRNDSFFTDQSQAIQKAFKEKFHQNSKVAYDWVQFMLRLFP